jgi:hypothetical protein
MLSRSLSPGRNHLRYVCTFPFQGRQMNEQRWNKVQSLMLTSSRWSSTTNHILVIILFVVSMPCWRDWFLLQGYTISLTIFSSVQLGTSWYQILLNRELIVVTEIMETARQIYPCKSLKQVAAQMRRTCAVLITRCSRQLVPRVTFWSQNEYETKENVKRQNDTKRIEWLRLKTRDRVLLSGHAPFFLIICQGAYP